MDASTIRIILVAPENPKNVGFVARAMRAFGAADLVIAKSLWKTLPEEAWVTGVRASAILEKARLAANLETALRGCRTAIAFSRRPTDLRQTKFILPAAPAALGGGRVALVFGRESNGLTREESALCPYLARIPCQDGISLNLGQAASVALFSLTGPKAAAPALPAPAAASLDRMRALWGFLEPRLSKAPHFNAERLRRARQMLFRAALDDQGLDILFAVMKGLVFKRPAVSPAGGEARAESRSGASALCR